MSHVSRVLAVVGLTEQLKLKTSMSKLRLSGASFLVYSLVDSLVNEMQLVLQDYLNLVRCTPSQANGWPRRLINVVWSLVACRAAEVVAPRVGEHGQGEGALPRHSGPRHVHRLDRVRTSHHSYDTVTGD